MKLKEINELKKNKKNKKITKMNIIKHYINKTINIISTEYTHEKLLKIFNHAFNYDSKNIEKEVRDRIHFLHKWRHLKVYNKNAHNIK